MRKIICCSISAWLLVSLIHTPLPARDKQPIAQKALESIIQNLPWVIQGEVINVEAKFITPRALGGYGPDDKSMVVTEVTIEIERMIAGEYDQNEIKIIIQEGELGGNITRSCGDSPLVVKVGDRAIVGIVPNTRGTGYNILSDRTSIFRIEGVKLVPYQKEYYLAVDNPLEVIEIKAREREMPNIFKAADLICTATVMELINPESIPRNIVAAIDELLKGVAEQSNIKVNVSDLYQPFELQKPGYKVMLFLRKDSSGYSPIAGVNGYYVIDGDRLFRGHSVPLRISVSQLKSNIRMWKEAEQ